MPRNRTTGSNPPAAGADVISAQQKTKAMTLVAKAQGLHKAGAAPAAAKAYAAAAKAAPSDLDVIAVAADGLNALGRRSDAIAILQEALQKNPVNGTILMVVGKIAQNLNVPEIAEKIYSAAIDLSPGEPSNYVNLIECYRKQEKLDQAVELAKSAIEGFPTYAALWNILGTLMVNQRQGALARTFYDEALRLAPDNPVYRMNLANLQCDQDEDPSDNYEKVIAVQPDNHEAHLGLATFRLEQGSLAEGWPHYEHRKFLDRGFSKSVCFDYDLPEWQGESLAGKSILVMAEQGLGDELLFAVNFRRLCAEAGKVYLGCDPRLVPIFKRSFPDAEVAAFSDQGIEGIRHRRFPDFDRKISRIDYCVWAGSLPGIWWHARDQIPRLDQGYLTPDPEQAAKFASAIPQNQGRLKVGLSWRSGNLSFERSGFYMGLEGARQFLVYADVDFYCLQYGWDQSEIDWFQEKIGKSVHTFADVDLKDDLEANLAIMTNMDLVIGPAIATQQMALALGVPTWIITGGAPWWQFGEQRWGPSYLPHTIVSSGLYGLGQERACRIYALVFEAYLEKFGAIDMSVLGPAIERALAAFDAVRDHTAVREFTVEYQPTFGD